MRRYFYLIALPTLWGVSCIKNAPLNPEADIEQFILADSILTGKTIIDQNNRKIQLFLTKDAYSAGIRPIITVSNNATVHPASGTKISPKDQHITYTVTSQNLASKKTYTVEIVNVGDWTFNFESWKTDADDGYQTPLENDGIMIWSSGNPGIALSGVPKQPNGYPTRATTDGLNGTMAAELVTIKGTSLSAFLDIYLYAGSMFIGNFNSAVVLSDPLAATEFGEPYVGLPASFSGYYKYTPGAVYQDEKEKPVSGKTDECSIYAVLFKGPERLNGKNVLTSDKVVATAILQDRTAKAAFTKFNIPFQYKAGWDSSANNLMMAIIASSSIDGDRYRGAIGSRLVVDSLTIIPLKK